LAEKLSAIFGFKKTTYQQPSMKSTTGTFEQDILFIQVDRSTSVAKQGKATSRVEGSLVVFAEMDKMPFGYFTKRIQQADPSLTNQFFFYDIDLNPSSSPSRIQNITERRVSFVYLYTGQYDPDQGSLTSLET
jgi:hypothetical protein